MISRFVAKPRLQLCVSLGCLLLSACQVYDPTLLDESDQRPLRRSPRPKIVDAAERDAGADASGSDAASALSEVTVVSCGNGVVDEGEACDTAIARGMTGACPDGCSGGQGCLRNELVGSACEARCVTREFDSQVNGDGCCPSGSDYYQDDDCAPRCGNDQLEPGERCDPASTCPARDACKPRDACEVARYLGAAESCNARCETARISTCKNGDGCCAPGCNDTNDDDCPAPMPPPFVCAAEHAGSACRECDCLYCGAQVAACLRDEAEDAMFCQAAIECAEQQHCVGNACYCGDADNQTCQETPRGACKAQWNAAARTTNPLIVLLYANTTTFTVGKASALTQCRQQYCKAQCGL